MPVYTYRREDGTTFEARQKFTDDPFTVDPVTGQRVQRVVQAAGVIFKGQGFYVNDSKSAAKTTMTSKPKTADGKAAESTGSESTPAPAKDAAAPAASAPAPAAAAS